MTQKQYISQLISREKTFSGMDIPQASVPKVIDGLCEVIADKEAIISERDRQIAKMHDEIIRLRRKIYGHSSEKLHPECPGQLSIDFGEKTVRVLSPEELKDAEDKVNSQIDDIDRDATTRRTLKRQRSSRKGKEYRISSDIPRDEPTLSYPKGYSEETMEIIGWATHEYLEVEPQRMHVRVEKEAICKPKGAKPTDPHTEIFEAHGTQNCLPGCKAGNTLMANIVVDKFCDHLPEYRQAKRYEAMGVHLPTSDINYWLHSLAANLKPICDLQAELIFSSRYQHLDESTIRVNDQKRKTRKGYIWSDVDGMGKYGLVFFYDKGSRGEKVISPKLLERRATLQTDGYVVYQNIEKKKLENLRILYCMAHARRKFEAIKEVPEAAKILRYIAALYTLEANLKYKKATEEEIYQQRQEKAVPILDFIKKLLDAYVKQDTPSGSLANACKYAIERWEGLCRYCEQGYYDIDNNAVERSIRPLTLGRKNWLFVDSDESAKDTAIYLTLVGSCNLLGIAPYRYFMTILPRLHNNMTTEEYEKLLPYKIAEEIKG